MDWLKKKHEKHKLARAESPGKPSPGTSAAAETSQSASSPSQRQPSVAIRASISLTPIHSVKDIRDEVWKRVYERLKAERKELFEAYETLVKEQSDDGKATMLAGNMPDVSTIVAKQKEHMESKQWTYTWAGKQHKVRDAVDTIFGLVQQASGLISSGMSLAPPYVSLPWSMIAILIPFVTSDMQTVREAITGLQEVSAIMISYNFAEQEFLVERATRADYESAVSDLYASILEYQAAVALYFAKSTLGRFGINLTHKDTWTTALTKTKELDEKCQQPINALGVRLSQLGFRSVDKVLEQGIRLLKQISQDVSSAREHRERVQWWISPIRSFEDHDTIRARLGNEYSNSGQWLLQGNETFRSWKASSSGILLLQGIVGSGKSCLTSSVIETLLAHNPDGTAFMYCSANKDASTGDNVDTDHSTTANILRCILAQLAILPNGSVSPVVQAFYQREGGKGTRKMTSALSSITSLLKEVIEEQKRPSLALVFDALDECKDYDELLSHLSKIKTASANIKIFCSARVGVQLSNHFADHSSILITDENSADIRLYIENEISSRRDSVGMSPDQAARLRDALLRLAAGMFRWVELEIELYLPRPTAQKRRMRSKDIEGRLKNLEQSQALPVELLMNTYEQIYAYALGEDDEVAHRATITSAIQWILCSYRPLTSHELVCAVAIQEDGSYDDDLTETDILEPCSNLFIVDERKVVRLAHLSVRQFFEEKHPVQYAISAQHHQAALSCLWSIKASRRRGRELSMRRMSDNPPKPAQDASLPDTFHIYGRMRWLAHYQKSSDAADLKQALQDVKGFLDSPFEHLHEYASDCASFPADQVLTPGMCSMTATTKSGDRLQLLYSSSNSVEAKVDGDLLHELFLPSAPLTRCPASFKWIRTAQSSTQFSYNSELQPIYMAGAILPDGPLTVFVSEELDLRDTDSAGNTPLHHAAFFDQPSTISDLLALGASIDQENLHGNTALEVAIRAESLDSILVLLRSGAMPGHTDEDLIRQGCSRSVLEWISKQDESQVHSSNSSRARPKVNIKPVDGRCNVCNLDKWLEDSRQAKESIIAPSLAVLGDTAEAADCVLCRTAHQLLKAQVPTDGRPGPIAVSVHLDSDRSVKRGKDVLRYQIQGVASAELEICINPHDNTMQLSSVFRTRLVSMDCVERAKMWLRECQSHPACSRTSPSAGASPTRLLDLAPVKGSEELRLIETQDSNVRYAYLSYTWGSTNLLLLTSVNYAELHRGFHKSALNPLIQDACNFCLSIGYRYIWIDSLCIIQDSPDPWQSEVTHIQSYVARAGVVLSTTSTSTIDRLLPSNPHKDLCEPFQGDLGSTETSFILHIRTPLHLASDVFRQGVIDRGWRVAEVLLPPRTIVFGAEQLYWTCSTTFSAQSDLVASPPVLDTIPALRQRLVSRSQLYSPEHIRSYVYRYWYGRLEDYSRAKYTVLDDRLISISWVANQLTPLLQNPAREVRETYCSGTLRGDLVRSLFWTQDHCTSQSLSLRPSRWKVPSWSWGSSVRPIKYGLIPGLALPTELSQPEAQFEAELIIRDDHGSGIAGAEFSHLHIKALLLSATPDNNDYWKGFRCFSDWTITDQDGLHFMMVAPWAYTPQGNARWAGLLVTEVKSEDDISGPPVFVRVGVFIGPDCNQNLDLWERRELILE